MTISNISSAPTPAATFVPSRGEEELEKSEFQVLISLMQNSAAQRQHEPVSAPAPHDADDQPLFATTRGNIPLDLDEYFTPKRGINFDDPTSAPPLLFPSEDNISALTAHASQKFRQLLADRNIPTAPAEITYGNDGRMQLPEDYAYADQLKQALASTPSLERELRTLHALTSHYAAFQEVMPYIEEYMAATSTSQIDAINLRYSYLFDNIPSYNDVRLKFSGDGTLQPTINGQPFPPAEQAVVTPNVAHEVAA